MEEGRGPNYDWVNRELRRNIGVIIKETKIKNPKQNLNKRFQKIIRPNVKLRLIWESRMLGIYNDMMH